MDLSKIQMNAFEYIQIINPNIILKAWQPFVVALCSTTRIQSLNLAACWLVTQSHDCLILMLYSSQ